MDSMGIVWHGNYVKYFEDGREAFGDRFGLGYMDVYRAGLLTPIVKMDLVYRKPLRFGEKAIVQTQYFDTEAAVINFEYKIIRESDNEILTRGSTVQAFVDTKGELILSIPRFFEDWKKRWSLIR